MMMVSRWGTPAVCAAGLLLAVMTSTAGAQQADGDGTVTAAVQVTSNPDPARAHSSPLLARNPANGELVVVETEVRSDKKCVAHMSVDEGRSWFVGGDLHTEPFTNCSGDPINGPYVTPSFSDDGTLYVAFVANDPEVDDLARSDRPRHVFLARSDDGGRSFTTTMVYEAPEGEDIGATTNRRPMVAADPGDSSTAYVSWLQSGDAGEAPRSMMAVTTDGGDSFTEATDIAPDDTGGWQARTAVDPGGTVHAVIPSAGFDPDSPPSDNQRPLWYRQSTDAGQTWSEPVQVDQGTVGFFAGRKAVLAADGDRIVVTWYGSDEPAFDPQTEAARIFMRTSTDGGQTWSERVRVNDEVEGAAEPVQVYNPGVAIAPNGRIDIAWYDFRNSPYPERFPDGFGAPFNHDGFQDVYLASSTDGGATFGQDVRLTDRVINREIGVWSNNVHSHNTMGIASTDDAVYVVWQDSRNGDRENQAEDAYFAALYLEGPAPVAGGVAGVPVWLLTGAALVLGMGIAMAVGGLLLRRSGGGAAAPAA